MLKTTAESGDGVTELLDALDGHLGWLRASGTLEERRAHRRLERVRAVIERGLRDRLWSSDDVRARLDAARADLESGRRTPYDVAGEIVEAWLRVNGGGETSIEEA